MDLKSMGPVHQTRVDTTQMFSQCSATVLGWAHLPCADAAHFEDNLGPWDRKQQKGGRGCGE